jgi:hypothetical protein
LAHAQKGAQEGELGREFSRGESRNTRIVAKRVQHSKLPAEVAVSPPTGV